ncbi:MAG: anti-sigma factor [Phycisphaerales bacterium]
MNERIMDLLADRALYGLSAEESAELAALLAAAGLTDDDTLDQAVAQLHVALHAQAAMPAQVASRVKQAGAAWAAAAPARTAAAPSAVPAARTPARGTARTDVPTQAPSFRFPAAVPWLLAAACLGLAVVAWQPWARQPTPTPVPAPLTLAQQRQAVLAAPDHLELPLGDFVLEGKAPEIPGVKGDVVWSDTAQRGYLRMANLPKNDPTKERYQLWIIDERGLGTRISGGIFDGCGNSDGSDCIVAIDPAIPIGHAAAFAITIEQPSGVWVSDMTRRVAIAAKGS